MKLQQIFHNTYKESPYKLELEGQNTLARAGLIKKSEGGDYAYSTIGTEFYKKVENKVIQLFSKKGYSTFLGGTPDTIFQGDVKSFRHLGKGLLGLYSHTNGSVWPKLGLAECRNRSEITSMHLWETIEMANLETTRITTEFLQLFDFKKDQIDKVLDSGKPGFVSSLYHRHPLGSGDYLECTECGLKFTANASAAARSVLTAEQMEMEEVHTPDIRTIQQLEEFFSMTGDVFLKTIVVEINGAYHAVLLKGDRELNLFKLGRLLGVHESSIRLADKNTFAETMGVEAGFIGPVGLKNIKIIADDEVMSSTNLICGGNKQDYHIKNVNPGRDYKVHQFGDVKSLEALDQCPECLHNALANLKGFKLVQILEGPVDGIHTEHAIKYIDQNGKEAQAYASRFSFEMNHLISMVAEASMVEGGLLFKNNLAPFDYVITLINPADEIQSAVANELYEVLLAKGKQVLLDDTDERAGVKFSNADLTGVAMRITVGKVAAEGLVEFKDRGANTSEKIEIKELLIFLEESK